MRINKLEFLRYNNSVIVRNTNFHNSDVVFPLTTASWLVSNYNNGQSPEIMAGRAKLKIVKDNLRVISGRYKFWIPMNAVKLELL